jgi:hypothetical protein
MTALHLHSFNGDDTGGLCRCGATIDGDDNVTETYTPGGYLVIYRDDQGLDTRSFNAVDVAETFAVANGTPYVIVEHDDDQVIITHLIRDKPC